MVSFSARDKSGIFGPIGSRTFIRPVKPSRSLPYLDGLVLRVFSQLEMHRIDHLADRFGFDDFDSLDVIDFIQEKASINVHSSPTREGTRIAEPPPSSVNRRSAPLRRLRGREQLADFLLRAATRRTSSKQPCEPTMVELVALASGRLKALAVGDRDMAVTIFDQPGAGEFAEGHRNPPHAARRALTKGSRASSA
jgi:hypothetical protein